MKNKKRIDNGLDEKQYITKIRKIFRFFTPFIIILFIMIVMFIPITAAKYRGELSKFREDVNNQLKSAEDQNFEYFHDSEIYDINNNLVGNVTTNGYEYVKYENLNPYIIKGYISMEDKNFFKHNGIDYKGISRAVVSLVKNKGRITQGGSTITQQVLKNNVIGRNENKYLRKVKEIIMAGQFEDMLGKEKVFEIYVNTNPYANQCYGIESASRYYFNKPSSELDAQQVAFLVGLSNAPTKYNPKTNPEDSKNKTLTVLKEFLEDGIITQENYNYYKEHPLQFTYTRNQSTATDNTINFVLEEASEALLKSNGINLDEILSTESGVQDYKTLKNNYKELIRTGGYRIYTSLNRDIQGQFQDIFSNSFKGYNKIGANGKYELQGAAVLVNNKTGMVESMIGGRNPLDQFNRGYQSVRQPGSAIKPLLEYAPAVNTGEYYPSLIVDDKPVSIKLSDGKEYSPKNSYRGFKGRMTMREAMARSSNTIAYQLLEDITPEKGVEYLNNLNFKSLTDEDKHNMAIALGGFKYGATPLEMAKGFSTLANNGNYIDNSLIYKIDYQFDNNNNINLTAKAAIKPIVEENQEILKKYEKRLEDKPKDNKNKELDNKSENIFNKFTEITKEEPEEETNKAKNIAQEYKSSVVVAQIDPNTGKLDQDSQNRLYKNVYHRSAAYMTLSMMENAVNEPYGTAKKAHINKNVKVVGKTGTTNDQKDAWFVGITPDYTLCVWVGYDQPRSLGFYGGDKPVAIWNSLMNSLGDRLITQDFEKPDDIVRKFVDGDGKPTNKDTGWQDIFSEELLNAKNAEKERIKMENEAKEAEEFLKNVESELESFKNTLPTSKDEEFSPEDLISKKGELESKINKIKDEGKKSLYKQKLESIWSGSSTFIEAKKNELDRQKRLKAEEKYEDELNKLSESINSGSISRETAQSRYRDLLYKVDNMENASLKSDLLPRIRSLGNSIELLQSQSEIDLIKARERAERDERQRVEQDKREAERRLNDENGRIQNENNYNGNVNDSNYPVFERNPSKGEQDSEPELTPGEVDDRYF